MIACGGTAGWCTPERQRAPPAKPVADSPFVTKDKSREWDPLQVIDPMALQVMTHCSSCCNQQGECVLHAALNALVCCESGHVTLLNVTLLNVTLLNRALNRALALDGAGQVGPDLPLCPMGGDGSRLRLGVQRARVPLAGAAPDTVPHHCSL